MVNVDINAIKEEIPYLITQHGSKIGDINFSCSVAGTTFIKDSKTVLAHLKNDVPLPSIMVQFIREPDNAYDKNAVIVNLVDTRTKDIYRVGYVPKDRAPLVTYALAHPERYTVQCDNLAFLGGDSTKKNIGVFFDYKVVDFVGGLVGKQEVYEGQPINFDFPQSQEDLEKFFK